MTRTEEARLIAAIDAAHPINDPEIALVHYREQASAAVEVEVKRRITKADWAMYDMAMRKLREVYGAARFL